MSIETQWLFEPSVLLQHYTATPSLAEIEEAGQKLSRYTPRSRQAKLHVLADLSELCALPDDLHTIGDSLNIMLSRSQVGWFVTFGANDVALNFAAALMPHFTRIQHKHFHNQQEAFDFLSMMDASLPMVS